MSPVPARRVVAVVVAYNRRELLAECLAALADQTRAVDAVVVVDNSSTDGTSEMLRALVDSPRAPGSSARHRPPLEVVSLTSNIGGAGGFAAGIARAIECHAPDLVWLMDDDTIPTPTALDALLEVKSVAPHLAILGSRAVWTDGSEHPMNTPKPRIGATSRSRARAAEFGAFPVRSSSFVSMMIDAEAVRAHGLPIADYFIWNDDFEYSTRILRRREGWYVPASVVLHKTAKLGSSDADPGARFYYEVRNKIWLFRFARRNFAWWEVPLYGAATARRWIRTLRRTSDATTLREAGARGRRDGLKKTPQSTDDVLRSAGYLGESWECLATTAGPRRR